jgi:anaerobic nitric oxide reductase transcription regulator
LRLTAAASEQLERYDWPGNVRELEHLLSRAALKAIREQGRGSSIISIDAQHLGLQNGAARDTAAPIAAGLNVLDGMGHAGVSFRASVDAFQRQLITATLREHHGKLAAAARALQLDRSNLVRTMARLGMDGGT